MAAFVKHPFMTFNPNLKYNILFFYVRFHHDIAVLYSLSLFNLGWITSTFDLAADYSVPPDYINLVAQWIVTTIKESYIYTLRKLLKPV